MNTRERIKHRLVEMRYSIQNAVLFQTYQGAKLNLLELFLLDSFWDDYTIDVSYSGINRYIYTTFTEKKSRLPVGKLLLEEKKNAPYNELIFSFIMPSEDISNLLRDTTE